QHCYARYEWAAIDRLLKLAEAAVDRGGDPEISAWLHLCRGRRGVETGEAAHAISDFESALATYSRLERWEGVALAYIALGVAHEHMGNYDDALEHLRRRQEVARRHELVGGEALALFNIGDVAAVTGRTDDAIAATRDALVQRESIGDLSGKCSALSNLAMIHAARNELEEALACTEEALVILRTFAVPRRELDVLLACSEIFYRLDQQAEARQAAEAAVILATEVRSPYMTAVAARQRAKMATAQGVPLRSATAEERDLARESTRERRERLLEWLLFEERPGTR
ncbi:MAG TPA: tetratricopeptide repeat protein, partial [Micromonosporaceae bacterium]|nr:tetratricopeptide repeat protein [Micromonosporaceae bacterium]